MISIFPSYVIQHLRNVIGQHSCIWLKPKIHWTICFLYMLFNALYSYYCSAVGSSLDVPAFHMLAGPDVCVHSGFCLLSPWCSSWSCALRSHQPLLFEYDLIHLIWPWLNFYPLMKPLLGWWCIVFHVYGVQCILWSLFPILKPVGLLVPLPCYEDVQLFVDFRLLNLCLRGFTGTMGFQLHEEAMSFSSQNYNCSWLSK